MNLKFGRTFLCWLYNQLQQLRLHRIWDMCILKTNKEAGLGKNNSIKFYITLLSSFTLFEIWKNEGIFLVPQFFLIFNYVF